MTQGLAMLERHYQRVDLTSEDEGILSNLMSNYEQYTNSVANRNDAAIMFARTIVAETACRATRDRLMPIA